MKRKEVENNWKASQKHELDFHIRNPPNITEIQIQEWTELLKRNLSTILEIDMSIFENRDVIEIGCGPRGAVNYIPSPGKRVGIDSLIEEYRQERILLKLDHVQLFNQKAEALEFPSATFDIALGFNALDHVDDIDCVLKQLFRILKPDGLFLLSVHTFEHYTTNLIPFFLRRIDPTHPYHFSKKAIIKSIQQAGFKIELANQQPLGLNHGNIAIRISANIFVKTLWLKVRK